MMNKIKMQALTGQIIFDHAVTIILKRQVDAYGGLVVCISLVPLISQTRFPGQTIDKSFPENVVGVLGEFMDKRL